GPDGTLIRVHSGADDGRATDPGMVRRYSTPAGADGSFRLEPDGARLRLVEAGGTTLSERSFRPDAEYGPVTASLLRRRDGTAFYVLVPDGSGSSRLPSGGARLRLTYRRDDTAAHPMAPIYSPDGLRADETVVLDL